MTIAAADSKRRGGFILPLCRMAAKHYIYTIR